MRGMGEHPAYEVHGHRENGEVFSIAVLGRLPETEALALAQQYADRWGAPVSLCRVPFVDHGHCRLSRSSSLRLRAAHEIRLYTGFDRRPER